MIRTIYRQKTTALAMVALLLGVPVARTAEMRMWQNNKGKTIRAEFLKIENSIVHLKLRNGKTGKVALGELSENDQEYVRIQTASKHKPGNQNAGERKTSSAKRKAPAAPAKWPNDYGAKAPDELQQQWIYPTGTISYFYDAYWTPDGRKVWSQLPSQREKIRFHNGYAVAEKKMYGSQTGIKRAGLIDKTGQFVIGGDNPAPLPDGFLTLGPMGDNGLIAFKSKTSEGERWGYMNLKGAVVLEPQWYYAKRFSRGFAPVSRTAVKPIGISTSYGAFALMGEFVYIDGKGKLINDTPWAVAGTFDHSGPALVHPIIEFKSKRYPSLGKEPMWFFLRPDGKQFRVDDKMKKNYRYRDGRLVTYAKIFNATGKAIFEVPEQYRLIDAQDGSDVCVLSPLYEGLPFRLVQRSTGRCYGPLLNVKSVKGFKEGLARFHDGFGSWGFIDRTGKVALGATFDASLTDLEGGYFSFKNKKSGKRIYCNREGTVMRKQ